MFLSLISIRLQLFIALIIISSKVENKPNNVTIKWMFQDYQFPLLFSTKIDKDIDADYKVSDFDKFFSVIFFNICNYYINKVVSNDSNKSILHRRVR